MTNAALTIHEPERAVPVNHAPTPMDMLDRAIASGADVTVLEKLMALHERWEANQGRKAFNEAIADARSELPQVVKKQTADRGQRGGSYRYEDMAAISRAVDPILSMRGLSYRFRTDQREGRIFVTCILSHRDGYAEETTLSAQPDDSGGKQGPQAIGSTVSYLQRYTLKAALGLAATKDDDGQAATRSTPADMTAEQYQALRARIDALPEADKAEAFLVQQAGAEIADFNASQHQRAMTWLDAQEKRRAARGGSNA